MLRPLRAALRAWLRRLRWPDDESTAILHAVDEACTHVIEHAYAFDDAGEIELTGREDKSGLRRHVVIDVLDRGRWPDTGTPAAGANGMAIMRGLMHRVNVHVRPDGTRVSLISCAVPQPTTPSRSRSKGVRTIDRDRVEFALDEAVAHCHRARELVGSARGHPEGRSSSASGASRDELLTGPSVSVLPRDACDQRLARQDRDGRGKLCTMVQSPSTARAGRTGGHGQRSRR
jgi:anti-sigma regulatory factor (Ser/Thr protein kinase)